MKAILEYTLPKEQEEFADACRALNYSSALWEIRDLLRNITKYDQPTTLQEVYQQVCEICAEAGIK